MASQLYSLDLRDVAKSLIVAIITAFLSAVLAMMQAGGLPTWEGLQQAVVMSIMAGVSYLVKNFLTNSQGETGTPEA